MAAYLETSTLTMTSARARGRSGPLLGGVIFYALLALLPLAAAPYGLVDEWLEAIYLCAVFALAALWAVEGLLGGGWFVREHRMLLPLALLLAFIFLQALPLGKTEVAGAAVWRTLSADPYETLIAAVRFLALLLVAAMLLRYAATERRLRALLYVVVSVGAASAVFGVVRQAAHHGGEGFILARLQPQLGYGQFINNNHFALLMEMTLGVLLGLMAEGNARRRGGPRLLLALAGGVFVWAALVLSNSRGGVFAMLCETLCFALLLRAHRNISGRRSERPGDAPTAPSFKIGGVLVRAALVACVLLVTMAGVLWVGGDSLATRMENLQTEVSAEGAGNRTYPRRIEMWRATWEMIKEHPFVGTGFGGYWLAIDGHYDASGVSVPQQAHNDYLEIASSGGLVAVVLVAWFVAAFVARARRCLLTRSRFRRAACLGALAGLCAVAAHSLVDFGLHITANALVFTSLVVVATAHVRARVRGTDADDAPRAPSSTADAPPVAEPPRAPRRAATRFAPVVFVWLLVCPAMWATARAGLSRWYSVSREKEYSLASAERAVGLGPADPTARFFRASMFGTEGRDGEALAEFERVAALRPRDHLLWLNLGFARERVGDAAGALAAYEHSVRLAPYYAQPRWQLGNALLRAGRRERACDELSRAVASDPQLVAPTLELLWRTLGEDAGALTRAFTTRSPAARAALARFLVERGAAHEAVAVLRSTNGVAAAERRALVAALLSAKKFAEAYDVWSLGRADVAGDARARALTMTDGSFERDIAADESGFGWRVSGAARHPFVALDTKEPRDGARSLRLDFKGEAPVGPALVSQLVLLRAGARYRLGFSARTRELTSEAPPAVAVIDAEGERPLAPPTPLPGGDHDWRDYEIEFAVPPPTSAAFITIRRQDCAAPCLIYGRLWLDNFSLRQL